MIIKIKEIFCIMRMRGLIIVLRYYLDLSHEDVAAITGMQVTAVRARASRALHRLRLDLATEEDL